MTAQDAPTSGTLQIQHLSAWEIFTNKLSLFYTVAESFFFLIMISHNASGGGDFYKLPFS